MKTRHQTVVAVLSLLLISLITIDPGSLRASQRSPGNVPTACWMDETSDEPSPETQGISKETQVARARVFQGMNPNLSVIGTLLGTASNLSGLERNYDLGLQEAEFAFQAAVDPYARADFYIGFGKGEPEPSVLTPQGNEHGPEDVHASEQGAMSPDLEEAYVTLLSLPFSSRLKAGKFRARLGKLNETHPHAYNMMDLPLAYQHFLGDEGLLDEGVSLGVLLPNPLFFQELTIQALAGPLESNSFARARGNELLYLAHLKNFFEINDNTTLELGVAGAQGPNNEQGADTHLYAADLTFKWKPLRRNTYRSFEWMTELLMSDRRMQQETVSSRGWFTHLRYQVGRRWFVGGMAEYSEFPEHEELHRQAYSGIVQFLATEFQKLELQVRRNTGNLFDSFTDAKLRAVFVIGSHGAHAY